jgi:thiamine biosynthesis lipoprotein
MEFVYSTKNPSVPTAYSRLDAMHTRCEILLPFLEEASARELVDSVWELVREADRRYNRFLPGSALSEVNRKASGEAVEVDDELFLVLQLCETFRKATGGCFDVSAGSRVPDRALVMDASSHTVRFSRPGMRLDLGGFVKGFVLEKAARLVAEVAESALLSFGGSSVAAVGKHPLGAPWPVSVAHSYYADRTAHTFQLEDAALSVSGKDPHGRGHIVDPATGNTLEKEGLVAVTGPSAMVTEVLSTALWVAPAERRGEMLAAFDGYRAWEILCRTDGQALTMSL